MRNEEYTITRGGSRCSAVCCERIFQPGETALLFGDLLFCAQCAAFVKGITPDGQRWLARVAR